MPVIETILQPDESRYTMFPIKYDDIWTYYKRSIASFWRAEEIDCSKDFVGWEELNKDEKYFISMILAFFSSSDGIVAEGVNRLMNDIQIAEARAFYTFQGFMEQIHSEVYSTLIDTYIRDNTEKNKLFRAIENFPFIRKKAEWAKQYIDSDKSFAIRLVANAAVEGIFFSSAFCSIYWLKKRGIQMNGLFLSNEFISRDEGSHCEFAVLLYSKLKYKLQKNQIYKIIGEAVEIEKEFICDSLPCSLIGMNKKLMCEYIEFVADRLLLQFGVDKLYNTNNPFQFMELIAVDCKTNFFEKRVTDYALAEKTGKEYCFNLSSEF
jgi:ribonucleotide reductase beta subunit family protein with ferritin-like domain